MLKNLFLLTIKIGCDVICVNGAPTDSPSRRAYKFKFYILTILK